MPTCETRTRRTWWNRLAAALLGSLLAATPGLAQEAAEPSATEPVAEPAPATPEPAPSAPATPEPEPEDDAALDVTIRRSVQDAREELDAELGDLGYDVRKTKDGVDIYVSEAGWKPRILVDRDGWYEVDRRPCVFMNAAGRAADPATSNKLLWAPCLLQPWACFSCKSQMVSKSRMDNEKREVADAIHDEVRAYSDALADRALEERVAIELPAQLSAIWDEGRGPDGATYATPEDRRAAMLALWRSRTCTEWGRRAQDAIEAWLEVHVQASEHPFTAEELAIEACGRSPDVSGRLGGP